MTKSLPPTRNSREENQQERQSQKRQRRRSNAQQIARNGSLDSKRAGFKAGAALALPLLAPCGRAGKFLNLLRNAQRHLSLEDYTAFKESWREIQTASGFESAQTKFRALLDQLRPQNKAYVEHLEKRVPNYLTFVKYPSPVHPQLRSTNLPEGLNNQIENLRRNAGGHFHSQREALIKMKLLTNQLCDYKWSRANPVFLAHLGSLNQMFRQRFESELNAEEFLTQNS